MVHHLNRGHLGFGTSDIHIHDSAPGFTFCSFGSFCLFFWCSGLNQMHRKQNSVYIVFLRATMHLEQSMTVHSYYYIHDVGTLPVRAVHEYQKM